MLRRLRNACPRRHRRSRVSTASDAASGCMLSGWPISHGRAEYGAVLSDQVRRYGVTARDERFRRRSERILGLNPDGLGLRGRSRLPGRRVDASDDPPGVPVHGVDPAGACGRAAPARAKGGQVKLLRVRCHTHGSPDGMDPEGLPGEFANAIQCRSQSAHPLIRMVRFSHPRAMCCCT